MPSNDFSLYDDVLDAAVALGAVPGRRGCRGVQGGLARYFATGYLPLLGASTSAITAAPECSTSRVAVRSTRRPC